MAKRGIVCIGQSNQMTAYFDNPADALRGHPNLYQYKRDGTTVLATQAMDFPPAVAGRPFCSYAFYLARDYLIPRFPGVDFCILPLNHGGSAFHNAADDTVAWHAPHPPDYAAGGGKYTDTVTRMNAFLGAEVGNTIDVVILQNGEEETTAINANQGYYATLSDQAAYTRYVTEFVAGLTTDVPLASPGGVRSWPFLIGGVPPDLIYSPTEPVLPGYPSGIGPASDGADHHASVHVPIRLACEAMPGMISSCGFIDPLYPTKLPVHNGVRADGTGFVWLNSSAYYVHYDQAAMRGMAHRAFKQYIRLKGYGTPITTSYGIAAAVRERARRAEQVARRH